MKSEGIFCALKSWMLHYAVFRRNFGFSEGFGTDQHYTILLDCMCNKLC